MKSEDAPEFERILCDLHVAMGYDTPPKNVVRMWWSAMQNVNIVKFSRACGEYFATRKGRPLPIDILQLSGAQASPWPAPEEAWNAIPKDEMTSAWMCSEFADAMAACQDSLDRKDYIAARLAFVEKYKKVVAGKEGNPKWWISEGAHADYKERLQQKLLLLESKPERLPYQMDDVKLQLDAMSGTRVLQFKAAKQLVDGRE